MTVITTMNLVVPVPPHRARRETVLTFGYVTHIGFAVVVSLQVLLYGLWSGMAYRAKCQREVRKATKKALKKSKK
jgi:hypothetical protein